MNTNKLKTFARAARTKLLRDVGAKLEWVLANKDSNAELLGNRREDVVQLERRINETSREQVVDEVAYTWFNRLVALRFMDANGYNNPQVVTPAHAQSLPEILQNAKSGLVDDSLSVDRAKINDLLDGRAIAVSGNPDTDVYRMLFVSVCNSWNGAMPFMFENLSSYFDLLLSDNLLGDDSIVKMVREGMSQEDCQQEELIGWLYQFYIAELKEEVEPKKSSKTGLKAEEIPAATQLFTPHWIVRYMVENTLGKIWMTLNPTSKLKEAMPYYIDEVEGQTTPIPEDVRSVKDIRFIDPCMGSGHVLVYAFELLSKMYEQEGYNTSEIPAMIFEHNLYGVDIDPRCTQLANFALTMKAQSYYRRYLRRAVKPHAIAVQNFSREQIDSCGSFDSNSTIYNLSQADNLGSLISVSEEDYNALTAPAANLFSVDFERLQELAKLLSQKYHCVVTNPPYLGKGMNAPLKKFVADNYPNSKSDLMATFMERCLAMNTEHGRTAMINQHSWMFLSSYEGLRHSVVANSHIESLLHLGPRTFPEIGGEVVQNAAFVLGNYSSENKGQYIRLVDYGDATLKDEKCVEAIGNRDCGWFYTAEQRNFEKIPGSPIGYWVSDKMLKAIKRYTKVGDIAKPRKGLVTLKDDYFINLWYEAAKIDVLSHNKTKEESIAENKKWVFCNKGGGFCKWYGMNNYIIRWYNDGEELKKYIVKKYNGGSYTKEIRSENLYFKEGITWGGVTSGIPSFRYFPKGFVFSSSGPSAFLDNNIYYLLGLLNSSISNKILEVYSPTLSVLSGDIANIPYYLDNEKKDNVEILVNSNIQISKQDWDAHETSWDFKTSPLFDAMLGDIGMATSQFSRSRLAHVREQGVLLEDIYKTYTEQWGGMFMLLHANEEELNRQFIEIYGLEDELTPDVPLSEITILQQGEVKIVDDKLQFQPEVILKQFMSYAVGCMMGRYSLDKEGLILANQGEGVDEYLAKVSEPTFRPDDDGIIPVLEGEYFLDDIAERFRHFVLCAFGEKYYGENLNFIISEVGDIRKYFYRDFYTDHVKMYKKRPIYWMFSSPKKNFQALVYMHRMRSDTPSKVFNDYLQPYIHKLEAERETLQGELLRADITPREKTAATKRIDSLTKSLNDCEEYARTLLTFASSRPTIDLDDGVKTNYAKFKGIVTKIVGLE